MDLLWGIVPRSIDDVEAPLLSKKAQHLLQLVPALEDLASRVGDGVRALLARELGRFSTIQVGASDARLMHAEGGVVAKCADRVVAALAFCDNEFP